MSVGIVCGVEVSELPVKVGLHQVSALSIYPFTLIEDNLTTTTYIHDEVLLVSQECKFLISL